MSAKKSGRKGYAILVGAKGKKQLLNSGAKQPWQPRPMRDIQLPLRRNLSKKVAAFKARRLKPVGRSGVVDEAQVLRGVKRLKVSAQDRAIVAGHRLAGRGKGGGKAHGTEAHDFDDRVVNKLAASVERAFKQQRGQKNFNVSVIALVRLNDGGKEVLQFSVPFVAADQYRFRDFKAAIRAKFYQEQARQLAFRGKISRGSANHIRRVMGQKELTPELWDEYQGHEGRGQVWQGGMEIATIESIEWRIDQAS
jgi:hypothetical protein